MAWNISGAELPDEGRWSTTRTLFKDPREYRCHCEILSKPLFLAIVEFLLLINFVCSSIHFFHTEGNLNQICHLFNNIWICVCCLERQGSVTTPLLLEIAEWGMRTGSKVYVLNNILLKKPIIIETKLYCLLCGSWGLGAVASKLEV